MGGKKRGKRGIRSEDLALTIGKRKPGPDSLQKETARKIIGGIAEAINQKMTSLAGNLALLSYSEKGDALKRINEINDIVQPISTITRRYGDMLDFDSSVLSDSHPGFTPLQLENKSEQELALYLLGRVKDDLVDKLELAKEKLISLKGDIEQVRVITASEETLQKVELAIQMCKKISSFFDSAIGFTKNHEKLKIDVYSAGNPVAVFKE